MLWPGAMAAQAIHVAAKLTLADLVASGPKSLEELAEATHTHGSSLARFLRALSSLGIFAEDATGRFRQTALSDTLRSDHPQSLRPSAMMLAGHFVWKPSGELEETLRIAQTIECPVICTGGGHPGGYTLDLGNRRPGLLEEVITCWQRAVPLLETYRIHLAFETGIHTTVYKPDQYAEIFGRIGSAYVALTMDVVNMLSAEDYYDQHPKIDALFDRARGSIVSAHLKDLVHEERLHTHLNEAAPGDGHLDWEYVLDHLHRALPSWGTGFIEATPWESMPRVIAFVTSKARAVGMPID